jgi:hypothetical protein
MAPRRHNYSETECTVRTFSPHRQGYIKFQSMSLIILRLQTQVEIITAGFIIEGDYLFTRPWTPLPPAIAAPSRMTCRSRSHPFTGSRSCCLTTTNWPQARKRHVGTHCISVHVLLPGPLHKVIQNLIVSTSSETTFDLTKSRYLGGSLETVRNDCDGTTPPFLLVAMC